MAFKISSMENAPQDRRIVAYGLHAWEAKLGWATVKWSTHMAGFICDPNEASEYDYVVSRCTLWFDLPHDGSLSASAPSEENT